MSGPKTSTYTLTGEQLKNFNAQSSCMRDTLACKEQINSLINELVKERKRLAIIDTYGSENEKVLEIKEQLEQCVADINACISEVKSSISSIPTPSATITISAAELEKREAVKEKHKKALNKLKEVKKKADTISSEGTKIKFLVAKDAKADIASAFSKSITIPENQQSASTMEKDNIKIEKVKAKITAELENFLFDNLPDGYKEEIKTAFEKIEQIPTESFLGSFSAIVVSPLIKKCQTFIEDFKNFGEEYEEKSAKYKALCKLMSIESKEIPFSKEAIDELNDQIVKLETVLDKESQDEYIADAIDEVMQEMGYDLIGHKETVKKSGRRFKNELYAFNEDTAVNIRYDSNGQIAMELGKIDVSDRIPTDSEISKLCGNMETFCGKFKEIEKHLAKRGIVCKKRISILPPTAEHAQIINVSDYKTTKKIETMKTTRHKAASKEKYMRNE